MLEKQVSTLVAILKSEDIRNYSKEAFWNLIKAVMMGDGLAAADSIRNIQEIIFHTPTILFWDKMKRYLLGTFKCYEDQLKMAQKFDNHNEKYEIFVKRQIHLINEIDDDLKVDFFANLTRCFLLTDLTQELFFKLTKFIVMCTPPELEYLKSVDYNIEAENSVMVSSLYQYTLFTQREKQNGDIKYMLSDFAKALKQNSLNYCEGLNGCSRYCSYEQLKPIDIVEPFPNTIDCGTYGTF